MDKRLRYQKTNGSIELETKAQVDHGAKPVGLWYSVDEAWKEWCEVEGFRTAWLTYVYELDVDLDRILQITTEQELLDFTTKYADGWNVNWQAVAEDWDGIEIAPYQYGCRFDTKTRWYYPWDVASGCLWGSGTLREARER